MKSNYTCEVLNAKWNNEKKNPMTANKPHLIYALAFACYKPVIMSMLLCFPYAVFTLIQPYLVGALLEYVNTGKDIDVFHNGTYYSGFSIAFF